MAFSGETKSLDVFKVVEGNNLFDFYDPPQHQRGVILSLVFFHKFLPLFSKYKLLFLSYNKKGKKATLNCVLGGIFVKAIILAAGKGTRLHSEQSDLPKVLRRANGKSLLSYVTKNVSFIDPADTVIVIGYRGELVETEMGPAFSYAWQREQLGTGHAVAMAKDYFADYDGDVLVLYGDMPLFSEATYRGLCEAHRAAGNDCTVLTSIVEAKMPYGRIIRDADGNFTGVVEDKDCTPEQKEIKELNVARAWWCHRG